MSRIPESFLWQLTSVREETEWLKEELNKIDWFCKFWIICWGFNCPSLPLAMLMKWTEIVWATCFYTGPLCIFIFTFVLSLKNMNLWPSEHFHLHNIICDLQKCVKCNLEQRFKSHLIYHICDLFPQNPGKVGENYFSDLHIYDA